MKRILKLFVAVLLLGNGLLHAQTTNNWWSGDIYADDKGEHLDQRHAFTRIGLSEVSTPDKYIGMTLSNSVGTYFFPDIPIELHKDYLFTVFGQDGKPHRFGPITIKEPQNVKGNLTAHIHLPTRPASFTKTKLKLSESADKTLETFLNTHPELMTEDGSYFFKDQDAASLKIFVNNFSLPQESIWTILPKVTVDDTESISLVRLSEPNPYFLGAILINIKGMQQYPVNTSDHLPGTLPVYQP